MKRFFAVLVLSFVLISCSSSDSEATCEQQYWDGTVALCLPAGWKVLSREELTSRGVGEEVAAAFQAEKPSSGQFPTVTVTREKLSQEIDAPAYSKASVRSVSQLPGYKLIDARPATIGGETVDLHIFTAQPNAGEPERRFSQVSAVSGGYGYTVTGLTPLSVPGSVESEVLLIVKSLGFEEVK